MQNNPLKTGAPLLTLFCPPLLPLRRPPALVHSGMLVPLFPHELPFVSLFFSYLCSIQNAPQLSIQFMPTALFLASLDDPPALAHLSVPIYPIRLSLCHPSVRLSVNVLSPSIRLHPFWVYLCGHSLQPIKLCLGFRPFASQLVLPASLLSSVVLSYTRVRLWVRCNPQQSFSHLFVQMNSIGEATLWWPLCPLAG